MWTEIWERYKGRMIGVAAGVFLGIVYLIRGFWDMLIVAFIIFVCYLLGKMSDEKTGWQDGDRASLNWQHITQWWHKLMEQWRMFR